MTANPTLAKARCRVVVSGDESHVVLSSWSVHVVWPAPLDPWRERPVESRLVGAGSMAPLVVPMRSSRRARPWPGRRIGHDKRMQIASACICSCLPRQSFPETDLRAGSSEVARTLLPAGVVPTALAVRFLVHRRLFL